MRCRIAVVLALAALAVLPFAASARAGDHVWTDTYVALGDSYASGTGTRSYWDTECERSFYAYPWLLFKNWPRRNPNGGPVSLGHTNVSCGGAKTSNVLNNQVYSIPPTTNYVTISIGGNDAGFGDVIKQCALFWPTTCWGDIDKAKAFIRNTLPGRLANVYRRIRQAAPFAAVLVVGYPRLFIPRECGGAARISIGEQTELNETADLMRDVTHYVTASAGSGFYFVDTMPMFKGHEVCRGSQEYLNGLSDPPSESFHPNRNGHSKGLYPLLAYLIALTP